MAERQAQLAYSDIQPLMLDRRSRTMKAGKIAAVIRHFLGRDRLDGLTVVDVGCSGGITAEAMRQLGANAVGMDIDVPALVTAREWFPELPVVQGDSQRLPLADESVDVIICNHVYEHVVDAEALAAEIHRVLKPEGIAYLGLGNRLGIMEPHHRLPFLSWLPPALADRYMRLAGKGDTYHERFRTEGGLDRLFARFHVWDYTFPVIKHPSLFNAGDVVSAPLASAPVLALRAAMPLIPTFLWVATKSDRTPAGPALATAPARRR